MLQTDAATLSAHVHQFTLPTATVYTDGWRGYNSIQRVRGECFSIRMASGRETQTGDGLYEVHTNTIEGVWTTLRNFLRPFRGGS